MTRRPEMMPNHAANPVPWPALGWFAACVILGGASNAGLLANAALQATAIAIIAVHIGRARSLPWFSERMPIALLVMILGGLALSLIPLPPAFWTVLPGRDEVAAGYRLLGMELPWLPISLADDRTIRSGLALLVPVASYLMVRNLSPRQCGQLIVLIAASAVLSVMLGMAQLLGGPESALRVYQITNQTVAVGLFANANHLATFLLVTIVTAFVIPISAPKLRSTKMSRGVGLRAGVPFLAIAIAVLGLVIVGSGAGLLLALPAAVIGWLVPRNDHAANHGVVPKVTAVLALIAIAGSVGAITTGSFADKLGTSALSRQDVSGQTLAAARDYFPTGSGLGSFAQIYLAKSGGQGTTREWMNHAHNDLAEVLLEMGLLAGVVAGLLVLWLGRATLEIWRTRKSGEMFELGRAGVAAMWLILIHSLVDYPLRTATIAALFGMALALVTKARELGARAGQE